MPATSNKTSQVDRALARSLGELFGSVTNAYRILNIASEDITQTQFRVAWSGGLVTEDQAVQINSACRAFLRQWLLGYIHSVIPTSPLPLRAEPLGTIARLTEQEESAFFNSPHLVVSDKITMKTTTPKKRARRS